jgi:hypothetical protein
MSITPSKFARIGRQFHSTIPFFFFFFRAMLKAKRGQSSNPLSFELSSSIVSPPHTFRSFTISAALLYRMDPHLLSSLSHNLRIIIIRRRRCVMCTHQICDSKSIIQKDLNKFSLSLYLMISSFQTTSLVALLSFTENLAQMIFV